MRTILSLAAAAFALPLFAQERPLPPPDRTPVLRLGQDGPSAPVSAIAFSPDGSTLYVGGFDKLVRTFSLKGAEPREGLPLRLPVGPGNAGAVNAVAVSPDGKWVAVAGRAPMRDETGFGQDGVVIASKDRPPAMVGDEGVIYLFDTTDRNGGKVLRGHKGAVRALAFASPSLAAGPVLISAGIEPTDDGKDGGVVRAWEIGTAKLLGVRGGFPAHETRPGLAGWTVGGKGLRAAVAWSKKAPEDGNLVVWDVAADAVETFADGAFNLPLAVRGDANGAKEIVSGGFRNYKLAGQPQHGRLTVRPVAGGEARTINFLQADGKSLLPLAVIAVGDSLAVLLETNSASGEPATELQLISAGQPKVRVPLGGLSNKFVPALTATGDGKRLAISGFSDNRVELYDVATLIAGKPGLTTIPGAVGGFAKVAFLADNKLWVGGPDRTHREGGVIFDFAARTAGANDGKAELDAPTSDATATFDPKITPVTAAIRAGGKDRSYVLRGAERPTAVAHLPAGLDWNKSFGAVVAVAHTSEGNATTLVTLFDAATGRRLRQLIGPEQPIRALAFSASRPLLAAVGDERTVAVWTLKDLDGSIGSVEGLVVTDDGKAVSVRSATGDASKLKAGDVIEAVGGREGKLEPMKSAVEFLWAVRTRPIGGVVAVQVKGQAARVLLNVSRGVDQRNPLLNLWLAPAEEKAATREWVGWSPTGLYDASSPATEARIGWLTTTGDPLAPTTFAAAEGYRKTYYRKGILGNLTEKGLLASAIDAWLDAHPPSPPKLRAWVAAASGGAADDEVPLLRTKQAELRIDVSDVPPDFPLDRAVIRWRGVATGGAAGPWKELPLADASFAADLSGHPWSRGRHAFEVELLRTPGSPRAVEKVAAAEYLPPPPVVGAVSFDGKPHDGAKFTSTLETIHLSARAVPSKGEEVDVGLIWSAPDGERRTMPLPEQANGEFGPFEVKLQPGATKVTIRAVNRGAGRTADREQQDRDIEVIYAPTPTGPPRIGRLTAAEPGEVRVLNERPVFVADAKTVRLSAEIEADTAITSVEWDEGDGKWQKAAVEPAGTKKLIVARSVLLSSDKPQVVRMRALCERGKAPAEERLELIYHPALPSAAFGELPASGSVTEQKLVLGGTLRGGAADVPLRVQVLVGPVGGVPAAVEAVLGPKGDSWTATVELKPGANHLGLAVRNEWRDALHPGLAVVAYRRPPKQLQVKPVSSDFQAVADVVATVTIEGGLEPTAFLIDGKSVAMRAPKKVAAAPGQNVWEVTAPAVPLRNADGAKEFLTVSIRNAEGDSEAARVAVKVAPKPPPAATISFENDAKERTTDQPRLAFRYLVRSESKLSRVEVFHSVGPGRAGFEKTATLDMTKATSDGSSLQAESTVALQPGLNWIRVEAQNSGGEAAGEFAVSYTPPAVRVEIDAVEEVNREGVLVRTLAPSEESGRGMSYREASGGFLRVRGRVVWAADGDPASADLRLEAQLSANDVAHLPVQLGPTTGSSRERSFRAPVFLNEEDTKIRIDLRTPARGAIAAQETAVTQFTVRCKAPLRKQRLHVVAIGLDVPQGSRFSFAESAVQALGGTVPKEKAGRFDRGDFRLDSFDRAILYPPLVKGFVDGNLAYTLDVVAREVKRLSGDSQDGYLNDVVLLYYQGKDWFGKDEQLWLHTAQSLVQPAETVTSYAIRVNGLPTTPGARLLVLNVTNSEPVRLANDVPANRPSILRYAWKDETGSTRLFEILAAAAGGQRTLEAFFSQVRERFSNDPSQAGSPVELLAEGLKKRPFGRMP